ncbi:Ail/Lom family outer membrane beta-barrel protein [Tatumella terrea]|uniref:Ail/Lom family outer membrane beta-barrel protein n=1 Tax=Tatumella terrea TaxID=419007 RepID=A0ABW1VVZ4_9GAMM
MKKYSVLLTLVAGVLVTMPVYAARHSVSLGYTGAKVADVNNLRGLNLKYRYEWNTPLSLIVSASYLKSTTYYEHHRLYQSYESKTRIREYSFLAGPAWRFNEFFSVYGQAGITVNKTEVNWLNVFTPPLNRGLAYMFHKQSRSTVPMVSLGTQINPLNRIVLDLSYDIARPKVSGETKTFSSFNLGAGMAF